MTLTVRLPGRVEQDLADYCVRRRITKSAAVKRALQELLRGPRADARASPHPFIGGDKGDGSDVSGSVRTALRARFRKQAR